MTLLEPLAAVALVVLVTYLAGRFGRATLGRGNAGAGLTGLALVDVTERRGASVAPLLPAEVAPGRGASRRRDSRLARRHYEALASEVARERRLAEYEAIANEAGGAGGRVVPLHARPTSSLRRPAHR
jgi:hypothetical protein